MGTSLYDINKGLVEKNIPDLTEEELQDKKNIIVDFINNSNNAYYMLLCNERKDYTIFHRKYDEQNNNFYDILGTNEENLEKILIDECLPNRGHAKSIELTENQDAIEIWISIDGESYCYYFFPYDTAVIEC
jgi:hypothetical protein